MAKKVRQWLLQIFRYAIAKGVIEHNPATDLDVVAAHAPAAKPYAHLPINELPAFLRAVGYPKNNMLLRHATRLLLLTAARPGTLRAAPWSEFDLDAALWTIPAERMKMRRGHVVPLPKQAVTILRDLHRLTGTYKLVFAGRNDPDVPMSDAALNNLYHRLGFKGRQTSHGFRHLISTALNERGYNRDWIERQLAHGDADEIRDIYNRAQYVEQRRKMMQDWADYLDAIVHGADIVPIGRKRSQPGYLR
ncbi:MAG: site-specific integrase [Rhodanobacteraceae bacterium]